MKNGDACSGAGIVEISRLKHGLHNIQYALYTLYGDQPQTKYKYCCSTVMIYVKKTKKTKQIKSHFPCAPVGF